MAQESKIAELLGAYCAFVTYSPLRTEVPWSDLLALSENSLKYQIAPRASLNPSEEAEKALQVVGEQPTAVLIPGRRFDASGTRHGQGGGWYDRFLAEVPRSWLRVGFCYTDQFSTESLIRNTWDQEMDIVMVVDRQSGKVKVIRPTH